MSKFVFADPNSKFVMQDPFPHKKQERSMFDSPRSNGLVPYPCTHGIAELPPGALPVAGEPRRSKAGGELPPYGGLSWGRSKYLRIKAPEKKPVGRPPERLTINIRFQQALGEPALVESVIWPKNWPLPREGDSIVSAAGKTHRVSRYAFNPAKNVLEIEAH